MSAAELNDSAVLQALLDAGADPKATNRDGRRAIDYAQDNRRLQGADTYRQLHDASYD